MLHFLLALLPFLYDGLKSTSHHWAPVVLPGKSAGPDRMERALIDDGEYSDCMELGMSLEACEMAGWTNDDLDDFRTDDRTNNNEDIWAAFAIVFFVSLGLSLAVVVGQCVFMCQYKSKVVDERGEIEDTDYLNNRDFKAGLCDCFSDCPTCLFGFCCTACRAGDTYNAIGAMSYYTVIGIFIVAQLCGGAVNSAITHIAASQGKVQQSSSSSGYAGVVAALVISCVMFSERRKLREKLGGNDGNVVVDCCLWYWCMPCVVIQEARDLDRAMGVQVECCCNLKRAPGAAGMVGNAYAVSGGYE